MKKILVANRGEIALRIMRSAKEMGIETVAVYSEADRNSPHVMYADEAFCIGPPPSTQSYLSGDKIIDICKKLNADAIHPGYGFLSENAGFARKVRSAGITFIGPTPGAMEIMGNKLAAKAAVKKYAIPMIPGTDKAITDVRSAGKKASEIGFPVIIKASAGGGGKGMRIVESEDEFKEQMNLAVSEAKAAFGDGSVFLERYIPSPRHIEFQILADTHGSIVHLFERECSIQRRHQKVIEEAPSVVITPEIREKMGKCAVDVARSCNYVGAGTVEFLYEDNKFYFLEMNTRLQVEHPVTEFITGIDLVKEQIRIARGEKLGFTQNDLTINGHAIEARVYAEDPENGFLPDTGTLETYKRPQGLGIRVDDGYEEGMKIPIWYDPLIAKLIVHGNDRTEAIGRMLRAIDDYTIAGVETTLSFCKYVMQHKAFVSGKFDTHFVKKHFTSTSNPLVGRDLKSRPADEIEIASLVAAKLVSDKKKIIMPSINSKKARSKWKTARNAIITSTLIFFIPCILYLSPLYLVSFSLGQTPTENVSSRGWVTVMGVVIDGDTMLMQDLPMVLIKDKRTFRNRREAIRYTRLVHNVKKVYPYSQMAASMLQQYNAQLAQIEDTRERKKLMKQAEDEIKEKYGDELKRLTFSQGMILIKLIDRETGQTSYELVKDLRGNFSAFLWQSFSRLFGINLKTRYNADGEDQRIEDIVLLIKRGEI